MKTGFNNDQYIRLQSKRIKDRIEQFHGKLYLEFGGKLFDDFHAAFFPVSLPTSKCGCSPN